MTGEKFDSATDPYGDDFLKLVGINNPDAVPLLARLHPTGKVKIVQKSDSVRDSESNIHNDDTQLYDWAKDPDSGL